MGGYRSCRRAQNVDDVIAMVEDVRCAVEACIEAGERPLVLGGDCTVGLGTIAAFDAPGLVYLDLHADMNVPSAHTLRRRPGSRMRALAPHVNRHSA